MGQDTEAIRVPELLAPAGTLDALLAAVAAGADAVYAGLGALNARAALAGFTLEDLARGCAVAHARGARVYVTLNVVVYDAELVYALELARAVLAAGADALIVSDLGLISLLREELPEAELHLSTQAGAASAQAAAFAARELGVARVTCARELSCDELCLLTKTGVPIEAFCHGAICIAYSGACAFSALRRGRSALRGDCMQPCRQSYELVDGSGVSHIADPYAQKLLCPRDYLGIRHVEAMARAGVASLKIEGRMKNPDYVYNVVRTYRAALDAVRAGEPCDVDALERHLGRSFNRGFTDAYPRGDKRSCGAALMSLERSCNQGVRVGEVVDRRRHEICVAFDGAADAGDTLEVHTILPADAGRDVPRRWPMVPMPCDAAPGERIWVRCKRRVEVGSQVFVTASARVLAETAAVLERMRAEATTVEVADVPALPATPSLDDASDVSLAAVDGAQWALPVLVDDVRAAERKLAESPEDEVAVCAWRIEDAAAWDDVLPKLTVMLDETMRAADEASVRHLCCRAHRVICRNIGQLPVVLEARVPFGVAFPIAVTNARAAQLFARLGARRIYLADEVPAGAAASVARAVPEIEVVWGCPGERELMVMEHCILSAEGPCGGNCASCERRCEPRMLVDTSGARLPVVVDAHGRSRVFDAR